MSMNRRWTDEERRIAMVRAKAFSARTREQTADRARKRRRVDAALYLMKEGFTHIAHGEKSIPLIEIVQSNYW